MRYFQSMPYVIGYFDRSGSRNEGVTIVSGWVATASRWQNFNIRWQRALDRADVPYFHMKEVAHFRPPYFDKWQNHEEDRRKFLQELIEIIADTVQLGESVIIPQTAWDAVNEKYEVEETFRSPFVMAAQQVVSGVRKSIPAVFCLPESAHKDDLSLVFDRGEEGVGRLTDLMLADGAPAPTFEASRGKGAALPLQAADFMAWELQKLSHTTYLPEDLRWPFPELRKSLENLWVKADHLHHLFSERTLEMVCELNKVRTRR